MNDLLKYKLQLNKKLWKIFKYVLSNLYNDNYCFPDIIFINKNYIKTIWYNLTINFKINEIIIINNKNNNDNNNIILKLNDQENSLNIHNENDEKIQIINHAKKIMNHAKNFLIKKSLSININNTFVPMREYFI